MDIFGIKPQYLDRRERRGMKIRIIKTHIKMTNKLRKFLRWTHGLTVIIKDMNMFEWLLRTKPACPSEEIERLVSQGQVSPFLKKHFKLVASIEAAATFNLGVQSTKFCDLMSALKQWSYSTVNEGQCYLPDLPHLSRKRSKLQVRGRLCSNRGKALLAQSQEILFQNQHLLSGFCMGGISVIMVRAC